MIIIKIITISNIKAWQALGGFFQSWRALGNPPGSRAGHEHCKPGPDQRPDRARPYRADPDHVAA
jgi:hypothetical protein